MKNISIDLNGGPPIMSKAYSLPTLSDSGGIAYEYYISDVNPQYRVVVTTNSHCFIFYGSQQVAELSPGGRLLQYKDNLYISRVDKSWKGVGRNFIPGLKIKGIAQDQIELDGQQVGKIYMGSDPISWVIDSLKARSFAKYNTWKGIEYDTEKLDEGAALMLFFSSYFSRCD